MPDEAKKSGTRVRVGYPYDEFHNHGVSGVPNPITREWTQDPVSDSKLKDLVKAAKAAPGGPVPIEQTTAEEPS